MNGIALPMNGFFSDDERQRLDYANSKTRNGFLVLFDIKDSTTRKREYKNRWIDQTTVLYSAFGRLCRSMCDEFTVEGDPIIKFKGDGLMAFFQTSKSSSSVNDDDAPQDAAMALLRKTHQFRESVHLDMADKLGDMHLKAVICYLTGISRIEDEEKKSADVLGRGIDFAHRLEAYADASHIVVNDMFYRALRQQDGKYVAIEGSNGAAFPLHGISCDKVIKGWEGVQRLWLLTNPELIEGAVEYLSPSPYENNALSELFCYYVNGKREELSGQSTEALVYREKIMKGGESDGVQ